MLPTLTNQPVPPSDHIQLGIPTANIPISGLEVGGHSDVDSGVYYGYASLSRYTPSAAQGSSHHLPGTTSNDTPDKTAETTEQTAGVFPMVMSIGWNPYYKNTKRSVEVHILHSFAKDFYGAQMKVLILGFIRPEYDYVSLDSLVEDIKTDIDVTGASLARDTYKRYESEAWLKEF